MQFVNLRMVDRTGMSDESRKLLIVEMIELFRGVVREWFEMNPTAQFLMFQPTFHPGDLQAVDLRCFILPDQSTSVVRRLRGGVTLGGGGTTAQTDRGTVSEVYDSVFGADYKSECAVLFHELMHNKLEMGNEMHADGEVGFGIASAEVEDGRSLGRRSLGKNGTNDRAMARALLRPVRQYQGD
jgi:hypothetical protein